MKKNKLNGYKLNASIHTFAVKSEGAPTLPLVYDLESIRSVKFASKDSWITRINLNKLNGDIFAYSEFQAHAAELFNHMQIPNCTYWRTDIRLDSHEDNFKDYYKLNALLISLFSVMFNDTNGQAISHMLTQTKEFSDISAKNQYWEVKYYNKKFQTNDTDIAKARLEFRSLKSTNGAGHPPHEIKEMWFKKLDQLPILYEGLQRDCNRNLYSAYIDYCNYNSKSYQKRDLITSFFTDYAHSMTVFTRRQLKDFLVMCGVKKECAEERARYICDKTNIEFFSKTDLWTYIAKIKSAMNDFFEC
ncbi:MAG: hypothetical protein IJH37_09215 [Clostridia bacterium]|nr:hypothetical protein [Clostridia bacterium]